MKHNLGNKQIENTRKRVGSSFASVREATVTSIRTELDLALQFLLIAQTSANQETIARNRTNAQKAYKTALQFIAKIRLDPAEIAILNDKVKEVESALRSEYVPPRK